MLKYLIFFILILFVQNMFTDNEKEYLKSVYKLTVRPEVDIIQNFREKFKELNEVLFMIFLTLKVQISKIWFQKTLGDELKIEVHDNLNEAINTIKENITKKILGKMEMMYYVIILKNTMEYDIEQWKKYDLLFSKGNKIKALSILTNKD